MFFCFASVISGQDTKKDLMESKNLVCDLYLCLPKKIANLPAPSADLRRRGFTLIQQRKYGSDLLITGFLAPLGLIGTPIWIAGAIYVGIADKVIRSYAITD